MIGSLAVSFCEKKEGHVAVCLDLWSYPDGTYNLVLDNFRTEGHREISFPCTLDRLTAIAKGKGFVAENEAGVVNIERCGEQVCADFQPFDGTGEFRHCIELRAYCQAMDALRDHAVGYLA